MERLCEITPFLRLPQSSPDSYDNYHTLADNLRRVKRCLLHERIEMCGTLLLLLSRFLSKSGVDEKITDMRIISAVKYIRNNLEKTITVDELASMSCMSKDYFIRIFKNVTGQTPGVYIALRKIERAELLLLTTDMSVRMIAGQVGYDDCSYFNRIFKKYVGKSPRSYRHR